MDEKYIEFKKFISFLKEHNAYCKYKYNYNRQISYKGAFSNPIDFFGKRRAMHFINAAFVWVSTREGPNYWFKLSQEWQRFIRNG